MKLYNADCLDILKEMPSNSIDLVVTDPPYYIPNTKAGGGTQLARSIQKMNNEIKDNKLNFGYNPLILNELVRVMKKINIYIWCNGKQIPMYFDFFVKKHKCNFEIIIWEKTNATPLFNNKYLTDKEYCLYFRKGGYCKPEDYNSARTVYQIPINQKDKKEWEHPTIKPLSIIKNLVANSSKKGDTVLDCFMGSGTTGVACSILKRDFIGIELKENFYKIAKERIETEKAQIRFF